MWGTLLAGTSMLGTSKGVAFATVMVLPLGLFAIPIIETSLSVLSAAFFPKPLGNMIFYRKLVSRGIDHPVAVFIVSSICAICGTSMALLQTGLMEPLPLAVSLALVGAGLYVAVSKADNRNDNSSKRPSLWGVSVDNVSLDYALGRVAGWVSASVSPHMIVTVDALAALRSRRDAMYGRIVEKAGLVLPDGSGLIWALRFLGFTVQEQISGVDFVDHLCRVSAGHGWSVYFLGGKPGVAERAARKLCEKYSGLNVAGCKNGYFKHEDIGKVRHDIVESGADILFVALGVPRQEYWLYENLPRLGGIVGMGVGGSFDVISGRLKRAPLRWRSMKLEWLYRVIQEPARWHRVAKLPFFVLLVLIKKLRLDTWKSSS
jgi:N-acetylglucosaminyldiphosphoundecaprenol N-acetyl-beta-D-mannosaminyltransferase